VGKVKKGDRLDLGDEGTESIDPMGPAKRRRRGSGGLAVRVSDGGLEPRRKGVIESVGKPEATTRKRAMSNRRRGDSCVKVGILEAHCVVSLWTWEDLLGMEGEIDKE